MLADRVRIGIYKSSIEYMLATDADFTGTTNGSFKYAGTNKYIIMPNMIKGVPVTSYASMFISNSVIRGVESNNTNVTNMDSMFAYSEATILNLSSFNTSNVTNMSGMFNGGYERELDLSNFDTSKVTNMSNMFSASRATLINLSSFNTSNVTNMSGMFMSTQATMLDLSSFDTSKVTSMDWMFRWSKATIGYARTQADAERFNASSSKPAGLTFIVKP